MKQHWVWAGLLVPCLLLADSADIELAISEGSQAYQAGQLSQAASQFDYAATLIRQQQATELGTLFPEPLSGWKADAVKSEASSAAFFGGGINATRQYRKDGGSLEISITKDSPLLQTMAMLFTNPSMASMGGYKMKSIKGQTAMVKQEDKNQELQLLIDNRILVQLTGRGLSEQELEDYATALDIEAISR